MTKELVLLDIDDVLAASAQGFTNWSNQLFGTNLRPDDYTEDYLALWPGTDLVEVNRRATLFHESDVVLSYEPIEEARTCLEGLADWYRFVAATSRRRAAENATHAWIEQWYGDVVEDVVFAGIYDDNPNRGHLLLTKADIYRRLSPTRVVDDQYKHCLAAAELGISAVMYGDYPWTRKYDIHPNVTWCRDWRKIEANLKGIING